MLRVGQATENYASDGLAGGKSYSVIAKIV